MTNKAAPQSSWPIVQVDSPQFTTMISLFRDLRMVTAPIIRQMQPRICLQCWMIIGIEDAPNHKGHNQTSDFAQMEEATRGSFLGLCKQYDRLTPDCKQVILMKVQPKITQYVEMYKKTSQNGKTNGSMNGSNAPKKKSNQIQEVDLTNAISAKQNQNQVNLNNVNKNKKPPQNMDNLVGKKRSNPEVQNKQNGMFNGNQPVMPPGSALNMPMNTDDQQKMMTQFPNMFNQFMMNAMQQNYGNMNMNMNQNKNKNQPNNKVQYEKVSPQTEQFQIKIIDMVKKLQKKCDQIASEIKLIRQQIKPNQSLPAVENSNLIAQINQNAVNALAEQNDKKGSEEKKINGNSQEIIDLDATASQDADQQKLVDHELQKIREENKKEKDGESIPADEKPVDTSEKLPENEQNADQKMTEEESKTVEEESKTVEKQPEVPKTAEQIEQEEKERKDLLESRQKMLQSLAGDGDMGMDFQEPNNDEVDMQMENVDKIADDAQMAQVPIEPQVEEKPNEEKPEGEKQAEKEPQEDQMQDKLANLAENSVQEIQQQVPEQQKPIMENIEQQQVPVQSEQVAENIEQASDFVENPSTYVAGEELTEQKPDEIIRNEQESFAFGQFDQPDPNVAPQSEVIEVPQPNDQIQEMQKADIEQPPVISQKVQQAPDQEIQQVQQASEQLNEVVQSNDCPQIDLSQIETNQQLGAPQIEQNAQESPAQVDQIAQQAPSETLQQISVQQPIVAAAQNSVDTNQEGQLPVVNSDAKTQDPAQSNFVSEVPNQAATSMTPEIDMENLNGQKAQIVSNCAINPEERPGNLSEKTQALNGPEVLIQEQRRSQSEKLV